MPLTTQQRDRIVAVAESWRGTPYRGCTCQKGVGADCGQLIKGVFLEAGFCRDGIPTPGSYSLQVTQHRRSTVYRDIVERYMREIPESEVGPGDVVLFRLGKEFAHGAIVKSWPDWVIHSLGRYGVTAGHVRAHNRFKHLPARFYTLRDEFCAEAR